ncbi:MAG: efflux RND transporter periplasmic adaptor subunit [Thermomonas sp.]|uniref:efflux RND transporter periplasmic adaptor subunit n=1 Tax=Thermomonas sp. TaxID=1971895 RepID=UPI00262F27AF|nr:efflux RND transporter periplasmic adaptor subunit [Thermomonas sp.]MCC7096198.1 efflux RND transporter periplasmic adaptor subunit [Thermomonas sp.]
MSSRRATLIPLAMLCLALSGLVACGKGDRAGHGGPGGRAGAPPAVTSQAVQEQDWTDALQALGTVSAREAVTVTAKVSETVDRVHFDSGQDVSRSAPLVTLSGLQQRALLASAEAQLADAQQQFQRMSQLAAQQLVARSALDSARASRDAASAQVAQIRANLSDRVIRAPFAGVLGIRQVSPGALVTPGTVIATLDDISRVYVDFPVPETELANVAPGQAVEGRVGAWPERTFNGKVEAVSARLDSATRSAIVRGDFPNPERLLKPGMLVNVRLVRATRRAIVVPEIAVQQVGSETFVWRLKADGTVEKADVVVGGRVSGKVMLRSGIKPGERIVVEGTGKLQAGMNVAADGQQPANPAR